MRYKHKWASTESERDYWKRKFEKHGYRVIIDEVYLPYEKKTKWWIERR